MRLQVLLLSLTFLPALAALAAAAPAPAAKGNYDRPFEPPTRPVFIPLAPGAVEPQGWLRDWCLTAKDGYTGHMDEVHAEFRRAWAVDHKMTGEHLFWEQGGWPYEGGGYWFEGLAKLGFVLHDEALIGQAKTRFDAVVDRMNPNGILFMWWLDKRNEADVKAAEGRNRRGEEAEWPMWANGLFGRAIAGYYAGSRDPRVLKAMETAYSGDRAWVGLGWSMSNAWPAFETYTWTGNQEIAEALTAFFAATGDRPRCTWNRYRRPPRDEPGAEPNDHGVHFCEATAPWALGYLWTGRREFLDTALAWYRLVERDCMQPHGVPVFDEFYGPTGAFRGTETCDVSAYMWSQNLLLGITGQGRMADRIERAFFNAAPAAVSRDFKAHAYFQSPNRMADKALPAPGQHTFQATHFPLCCTAALNRFLPNYVMHMWMATRDGGLAATCYGPCKVSALAADRVPVQLACRTDYPFGETVEIAVSPEREAAFPLAFRIPGWCTNPELWVNGTAVAAAPDADGFVRVERSWKAGDTVRLRFPMRPVVTTGRDANAGGAPYASVALGPLLFALPIPDTRDANTPDPAARWQFALDEPAAEAGAGITVARGPMPARWTWPLASPLTLRARAVPFDWKPTMEQALPAGPVAGTAPPQEVTLVPYGCTSLRISMWPVTERTLAPAEPDKAAPAAPKPE